MAWTLCTSGAAIAKAGANSNSTIIASGATLAQWSEEAEGRICIQLHTDVVTNFSSYDTLLQYALSDACSSLMAMQIINYDMSGYTSRQEAGTMLDVQDSRYRENLKILEDKKMQRFST